MESAIINKITYILKRAEGLPLHSRDSDEKPMYRRGDNPDRNGRWSRSSAPCGSSRVNQIEIVSIFFTAVMDQFGCVGELTCVK